jgi:hypothetical protein
MKNYRLLTIIGAALASLCSSWLPVAAQTYNGASVYRDTDTIYRVGLPPNSDVSVVYQRAITNRTVYSDACGYLKLSFNYTSPPTGSDLTIQGRSIGGFDPTLISAKNPKYKCKNGMAVFTNFTPPTSSNSFYFSSPGTGGAAGSSTFYTNSMSAIDRPNQALLITEMGSKKKTIKANSCGFVAVKALPNAPFASFTPDTEGSVDIGNTSQFFSELPVNPNPPICLDNKTYSSSTAPTTYMGAALYRTSKAVYYTGLVPKSSNTIELNSLASKDVSPYKGTSSLPVTPCGVFQIKFGTKSISSLKIGTTNYTVANLPVITAGGCSASELATITPNTLYRLNSSGNAGQTEFVYRVSDVNQKKLTTFYPTIVSRNAIVNACGFAEIKSLDTTNGFNGTDKVKINGAEYTIASLPLAPSAPICKNGVTYQAAP